MSDDSRPNRPSLLAPPSVPEGAELVMRVMPLPADVNANGDVFGGWIMAQVDIAGAVLPARVARGRIATVAVNQFVFKQAVSIGQFRLGSQVASLGNSSSKPTASTCSSMNCTMPA
jgi:acyl-CoA thioesterase YciA